MGVEVASADQTELAPGESAAVELRLLYEQVDYFILKAGTRFDILEGETIVGSGTVLTTHDSDDPSGEPTGEARG